MVMLGKIIDLCKGGLHEPDHVFAAKALIFCHEDTKARVFVWQCWSEACGNSVTSCASPFMHTTHRTAELFVSLFSIRLNLAGYYMSITKQHQ
jgi:hypothetical protein